MDFRHLSLVACLFFLSACGEQKTSSGVFEKAGENCSADILPKHFVVKYLDGRLESVEAESKEAFLSGFVEKNLDQIEFAEHDFKVSLKDVVHTKGSYATVADNWGVDRVNAASVWQQGVRGAGITVAVVDTGMDLTHPQLKDRIALNPNEVANGVDDDGNGLIDDIAGWDFASGRPLQGDHTGHGTHVAGIIAASHTDTQAQVASYVQGLAPEAKILPLAFLDDTGSGSMLNGVYAIKYAVSRGAKVINASWGGDGCSRALKETIAGLQASGVIFVSAAGNESQNVDRYPIYPASFDYPAQIVVGATGNLNLMAEYSNYGIQHVHIFAPGTEIVSTFPNGRMASLSGTSMATPFVTGAIALLLSAEPHADVVKIRQALYSSASKQSDYLNASKGRLDLTQALAELRK